MHISSLQQAAYQPIERIPAIGLGKTLNQANKDFQSLSASLGQGDVSSAQSSFNDLRKLLASAGSISAANSLETGASDAVKNDFDLLGRALGAGDVATAQKDLAKLKGDVQSFVQRSHGHQPGLPVRLPGGNLYQAGLSAAKSIAKFAA